MREPFHALFPSLRKQVRHLLGAHPECHGWDHTIRVWHCACRLAAAEGADTAVVEYAALLHDIGRADEIRAQGKTCHARIGAERVPSLLAALGVADTGFVEHVAACVRTHRYRQDDSTPATREAKVVYDADKLDSIGAIGIGRAFHFAGRVGARVHNTADEAMASEPYGPQDTAYREYLVKLRHIREAMLTTEGRRLAERRHTFMRGFFERLELETQGLDTEA